MTETSALVEDMTRSELEDRVRELEDAVEDLRELTGKRGAETNQRMSSIEEQLEDVQAAVSAHGEQLSAIADVGGKKTSKDEKITAIATFAMRKSDANSTKVLVDAGEIQGCVDCSRRYAYDLIDDLAEDDRAEWASLQKAESVPTYNGHREKKKALRVNVDVLQESSQDQRVVNKFTTRSPTGGA